LNVSNIRFTTADTEDTEGAQRKASDDLKFEIMNAFLCAPSALSVSAVVDSAVSLFLAVPDADSKYECPIDR
jgi:hypothetical protein